METLYNIKETMTRNKLVEMLGFERKSGLHRALVNMLPDEIKAGTEIRLIESSKDDYYTIKIGLNNDNIN